MSKPRRARHVALSELLARQQPEVRPDVIASGRVLVDGRVVTNPSARVRADAALRVMPERRLRGAIKLSHALDVFGVAVAGRVAVDVGACTGGFTTALLERGALRVYAVDVGVGQLLGRLRLDPRVVNLEGVNVAQVDRAVVPEPVHMISIDVSYLALADALPQLESLHIVDDADLIMLVKPTFELRRGRLANSPADLAAATDRVTHATRASGWTVRGVCAALPTGQRGALEMFVHAGRAD